MHKASFVLIVAFEIRLNTLIYSGFGQPLNAAFHKKKSPYQGSQNCLIMHDSLLGKRILHIIYRLIFKFFNRNNKLMIKRLPLIQL